MVESITAETFRTHFENLNQQGLLSDQLAAELTLLAEGMDGFSNWLDARKHLIDTGAEKLSGAGPISKFLRVLAFALDRIAENSEQLKAKGVRLDRIALSETSSGCSDFRGRVALSASDENGGTVTLAEGPFLWDCAEHGMPQPEAAQRLGYRCMIQFPSLDLKPVFAD